MYLNKTEDSVCEVTPRCQRQCADGWRESQRNLDFISDKGGSCRRAEREETKINSGTLGLKINKMMMRYDELEVPALRFPKRAAEES